MSTRNRIKELRKEKGLSQKEFAKAFNEFSKDDNNVKPISYATVSRWENGENEPKLDTWLNLANFFDVSVSYLQGISSIKKKPKDINPIAIFNKDRKLAEKILSAEIADSDIKAFLEIGTAVKNNLILNDEDKQRVEKLEKNVLRKAIDSKSTANIGTFAAMCEHFYLLFLLASEDKRTDEAYDKILQMLDAADTRLS